MLKVWTDMWGGWISAAPTGSMGLVATTSGQAAIAATTPIVQSVAISQALAATWTGLWLSLPTMGSLALESVGATPDNTQGVATKARAAKPKAVQTISKSSNTSGTGQPKAKPSTPPALDDRPAGLAAPRDGKPDDLKRISGVGPKLESVLNDLGIYHFDQIAAWSAKEIDWVDAYLKFKGRIGRDGWIDQAKTFLRQTA